MSREEEIFAEALGAPLSERDGILSRACLGNPALRLRIEALLASEEAAARFFALPIMAPRADAPKEKPGDRISTYKLLQKIGEGGCGVVYMAEQEEPVRRRVALKVIKLGMDTKAVVARFNAERQALALMDHPNIAKVLEAGATHTGRPFFVMELVRGIPITRYCDENHLTAIERVQLFITVCHAIQHAHQKGIIHRDIKPSNILVTVNDGAPIPKVIDFGIAKATQGRLTDQTLFTAFEQFIGTPMYMSPEQADMSSLDVDTRSDIYSLGVLLYELLTGRPPFDPKSFSKAGVDEIRQQIRSFEPPRPSTRLKTLASADLATAAKQRGTIPAQLSLLLRGDLDWIVMRCLEKDRTRRYDTVNGLATDLERYLRHEPVMARPPSTAYLLGKLVRRHRIGFVASASVAVALIVGGTGSAWQAVRAIRAEKEQSELRIAESALRRRAETAELITRRRSYISDINLVQQALAVDDLGRAKKLLDRQRPNSDEADLRAWEWRYLWQSCQSDSHLTWSVNEDALINTLAVSADGNWLAAGEAHYGGLSIWDMGTKEKIPLVAGTSGVRVAFSPHEASPLLAIALQGDDLVNRVWLWDVNTRTVVREISLGSRGTCIGLAFSKDGQSLATATSSAAGEICVWRVSDGALEKPALSIPATGWSRWSNFAFNSDFTLAAYTSEGRSSIHVVDVVTREELWTKPAAEEVVLALAFSPDGSILASGAGFTESTVRLWDARSGGEVGRLEGHRGAVTDLTFFPDGRTLASASGDHTLRIWDVEGRREIRKLRGHASAVHTLALLPDQQTLVSGARDGAIMFWDSKTQPKKNDVTVIPNGPMAWQFGSTGDAVISVEPIGLLVDRVVERRGRDFQIERVLLDLRAHKFSRAVLARDRPLVAAYDPVKKIEVWDWRQRKQVREFLLEKGEVNFQVVAFLRGGEKVLITRVRADRSAVLEERELSSGRKNREWELPSDMSARTVTISPDGRFFAVATSPRRIQPPTQKIAEESAWVRTEFATGRQVVLRADTREAHTGRAEFSPEGKFFASGSGLGFVDLIDVASWKEIATLQGPSAGMYSPTFSPDGLRLAVGSTGAYSITIWDVTSFECVLTLATPSAGLSLTAFSNDGHLLGARRVPGSIAGGSEAGAFYIWRTPSWAEIEAAERQK